MMTRGLMIGAVVTLVACEQTGATRSFDDPAVQELFTMASTQYYANLTLANAVAMNCARYEYDADLDEALNEARNEFGRGSLSAFGLREAIEVETDVSKRSFEARHGVDVGTDDLCSAGDAEVLEGTALSAMLVPVVEG